MKSVKKAALIVALSLVGIQVQAGFAPNWFYSEKPTCTWIDSVKSTLKDASTYIFQLSGDVIDSMKSHGSSLYSTVNEQGSSLYSSFNELDVKYKALIGLGAAGGCYVGYKYFFAQPKEDKKK